MKFETENRGLLCKVTMTLPAKAGDNPGPDQEISHSVMVFGGADMTHDECVKDAAPALLRWLADRYVATFYGTDGVAE